MLDPPESAFLIGVCMPQRFLSIKNLEKYQTNRKENPPWFKIHRLMFGDPEFVKLTPSQRFLYIGLIHLAVESGNRIYNCSTFIGQRLYIKPTEVDLKPLYRAGFLFTSNLSRVLSETEERRDRAETEEKPVRATALVDSDWLTELGKNAAYKHINLAVEIGKMEAWLGLPKNHQRKKTRSFVLNWLNKIEAPMANGSTGQRPPPPPPKNDPIGRGQWKQVYGKPEDHGYA